MIFECIILQLIFQLTLAIFIPIPPHGLPGLPALPARPPSPRLAFPLLPGLQVDPLSPADIWNFVPGWGVFNLGADVYKIIFTLQNKKGNYEEQVLKPEDLRTFNKSSWDKNQKTIIVIHGYTEDGNDSPLSATKKIITAYIEAKRPENLIFVDWHELSRQINYFNSADNTKEVGLRVAELLIFLRNSAYITNLADVHIVGFSLGAHCTGVAAHYAGDFLNQKIGRATGLDPAGPGFKGVPLEDRLDPSDATFVDVIHTNMGDLLTTFGTTQISGHVDFFPNGGEHQPGCQLPLVREVVGVCSHLKAPEYYCNSITGASVYIGCKCENWNTFQKGVCACTDGPKMGEFVDPSTRGLYYLTIPVNQ